MSRPGPPPPPGSKERRQHPRYELLAQVELRLGGEVSILPVSNISAGGIAVTLSHGELPGVDLHDEVTVYLDHDGHEITADAEVVRISLGGGGKPPSFALMWKTDDPEHMRRLAALLQTLGDAPVT